MNLDVPKRLPRSRRWGRAGLFNQPYLLLILANLFWSGNFVLGRAVRLEVPPVGLAFWRWCFGSIFLLGLAWPYLKRDGPALRQNWRIVLLLSLLGIAIFNTLVYTGLQSTTAINALLMQSTMPVIIVLMSFLFFREVITPLQGLGVALSLSGVLTIVSRGQWQSLAALALNGGDLLVLVAVVSYSAYSVFLRQRPVLHPLSFLAATFILGALALLPFYAAESLAGRVMAVNTVTLLAVGYVAIFPSILAFFCFNRGVELVGANRASLFFHLLPVFGSLMAILFLGERFELFHALGIVLILAGIALATRVRFRRG